MKTINRLRALALGGFLLALAGCASGPEAVENDYGNSVRHMMQAQKVNPAAPVDNNPIDHGDGVRINNAIETQRKNVADPNKVKEGFDFGTDSSGS
jgi:hypothetical protein